MSTPPHRPDHDLDPAETARENAIREVASSRMSGGQGSGAIRSYDVEQLEARVRAVRCRFTYQVLRDDQADLYTKIGGPLRDLAELLVRTCPAGRELDAALERLVEARMHANAAIALHGTEGA